MASANSVELLGGWTTGWHRQWGYFKLHSIDVAILVVVVVGGGRRVALLVVNEAKLEARHASPFKKSFIDSLKPI